MVDDKNFANASGGPPSFPKTRGVRNRGGLEVDGMINEASKNVNDRYAHLPYPKQQLDQTGLHDETEVSQILGDMNNSDRNGLLGNSAVKLADEEVDFEQYN